MDRILKIKVCPTCGSQEIKKVRKDVTNMFAGQSYTIPLLEFYECPGCGEKVYDRDAMQKIESISPAFNKVRTRRIAVG